MFKNDILPFDIDDNKNILDYYYDDKKTKEEFNYPSNENPENYYYPHCSLFKWEAARLNWLLK